MNQDRHATMSSIIKELAAKFIQSEANPNPLITVTNVDLSPDWKRALVMITTIPDERSDDALVFLKRTAGDMRHYFKKHGRFKTIPHLDFMIDVGEKHRQHMDEMVNEIKAENEKGKNK